MAIVSIEVSDEQAEALHLMTDDDGEKESVTQYVQRMIDYNAACEIEAKRKRDFEALSDEAKTVAISEGQKI